VSESIFRITLIFIQAVNKKENMAYIPKK